MDRSYAEVKQQQEHPFIHLRVHTEYSLCEGAAKTQDIISWCTVNNMPACSITDTNNMFGALDFAIQASNSGIQPIIGCQIEIKYMDAMAPLVLIAQNEAGYKNLLKLMTCFYNIYPVTIENLQTYNEGIIALSGGYKGISGIFYLQEQKDKASQFLNDIHSIYRENLYIEISRTFSMLERRTEDFFVRYALDKNIPLVATNEVFFLDKGMHKAQEILMCINDGMYISQPERRIISEHSYFKNSDEMYELFRDIPEAVFNTSIIARRCSYMPEPQFPMLPGFSNDLSHEEDEILEIEAKIGLAKRIEENRLIKKAKEYNERLEYEYNVIKNMGFAGYFLIVSDFVKWAKNQDIPVGPGRGSGAGSIIAWSLFITDMDPIKYNLIFERFLNPDRVSMPDFDIDFCQNRRDEVIKYVQEKYGKEKVGHIIALGKLQARAVLRDVGRVIQMPYGKVDRICKLVPNNPTYPIDLKRALEIEPTLVNMMAEDESVNFLINTGLVLEGLYRHASVHAAGIVIGDRPIDEIVPIYNDGESNMTITQFNMKFVEKAGLVKFDFLGLKTLTLIKEVCDLVGNLDITKIDLEDSKTFKILQDVNVMGVFQLESVGIRDVLQKLKPDRLEDLIALVSLYRPGPIDDIPKYLARKHGEEEVTYLHPCLKPILSDTYGVMVYQEQVIKISQVMGGYTLAEADLLRRAMGKKIATEMVKHRQIFRDGAAKNGIDSQTASAVFAVMEKFAGYGFNRSHAAPYALLSYQTAYLKANHMNEFFVAAMSIDIDNTDKIAIFVQDAKSNGIDILLPDINKSDACFKKEENHIRYALGALKGSSVTSVKYIVEEREKNGPFKSVQEFFKRISKIGGSNKRIIEGLIMSGVFDSLNNNRNQVMEYYTKVASGTIKLNENVIQRSLFGSMAEDIASDTLSHIPDWNPVVKLEKERGVIGFYLSAHPMDSYSDFINVTRSKDFGRKLGENLTVAGILLAKTEKLSKNAQKYAFLTISDQDNSFEVSVLPDIYKQTYEILKVGRPLLLDIFIKNTDGNNRITANSIDDIDAIMEKQKVYIKISTEADINKLCSLIENMEYGENVISFIVDTDDIRKTEIETKYKKNMNIENRKKILTLNGVKLLKYLVRK
ncbi:MAG: DNA polymerase III subunit alpha [Holosporales bacterium]|jgi:DNA polymerase-3 subunit alpha|nr:DNA polymerase III subunit alpha [Holosporales bacterium]